MKILVFCALVFGLETVFGQTVTVQPLYQSAINNAVAFATKKTFVLSCHVNLDGPTDPNEPLSVEWRKEGVPITEIAPLKNRYKFSDAENTFNVTINDAAVSDVGNWTCAALLGAQERAVGDIHVVTTIAVRIKTDNINVVEEEKLRIECSVLGTPYPALSWRIATSNYDYNDTEFADGRVLIQDYTDDSGQLVENGVLVIEKVNKEDRGEYYCFAVNRFVESNAEVSKSMIRVKDKYAALWPFLGIVAEVVVLCAVIVIYEKKRNKTELEESDTDQSPDQKNTPDHGKENLRHRQ